MKNNLLNISGVSVLSKKEQKNVSGGLGLDLSKCGCDCAARVTGPKYCSSYIACPAVYTCNDEI
ncbi:hypothetical protein SAMN04489761_0981 [Tenacibaculum sp. MAR_2009_124]|uniref:hypothetical protein n=1 Tax=Tenacibaculum sp. MAR_2009_124 TaxID=1250059 RepID=UPI0008983004|nr:hypothetical protein [Tenacibaculum sp. MAR_2009_124]SEB48416.1 hypothetical protein SAMN04489761_0981 [Tenacibaculum sp. MAR_2009_124]